MRFVVACLLVVIGAVSPPIEARAQAGGDGSTGSEGALFLLLPVGAQGVALGRAMTAVAGSESAFWNPAGLVGIQGSEVVLFRGDHVVGPATAISGLWKNGDVGTLGASYLLLDAGELDQRDENGNYTGTITIRNHLGILSGATRLFEALSVGVSFKVVQFRLSCRGICPDAGTSATTYAVDAGFQARPMERLRIGAMVAHLGPRLQVLNAEQADPLPARVRVAASYDLIAAVTESAELAGWVGLELQDRIRDPGSPSLYLGTELTAGGVDAISLRAGYVLSDLDQEDGARVGLGVRYERFDLSIAKSLSISTLTGETEPVHVTFAIAF